MCDYYRSFEKKVGKKWVAIDVTKLKKGDIFRMYERTYIRNSLGEIELKLKSEVFPTKIANKYQFEIE